MKQMNFKLLTMCIALFAGLVIIPSCKDDEGSAPPVVTLSDAAFTGKIGETASTTVNAVVDGSFKELRITKYLGTDIETSYGTNGTMTVTTALPFTLDYVLNEEGAETPVRFQFTVEDNGGQTDDANFVITTELTLAYVLTRFDWQWESKIGKAFDADPIADNIAECEKDNVYSFNQPGTMSLDYGLLTGTGGATCDFDGLSIYDTYSINSDETELTLSSYNVFDPTNITNEVYTIVSYSLTDLNTTTPVDLTYFGGILFDWTYTFKAIPK